jgi:hypothetical protein
MKTDMLFCHGSFNGRLFMLKEKHTLHCLEIKSWKNDKDIKRM